MWRSIFLHEFPGGNVRVFSGIRGTAAPGSFDIHPEALAPGTGFTYQLADPLDEVIGFSGRVRLHHPISGSEESVRILAAGAHVDFRVQELPGLLHGPACKARCLLRIGQGAPIELGTLIFPHREFVDLRFDWHTSGQARLMQNGQLVGYHNALASGATLVVPDITLGRSDVPAGTPGARYGVARVFVRALRRSDTLAMLSALLPRPSGTPDPLLARCRQEAARDLLAVADKLRAFMTQFHAKESTPWSLESNPGENAFTRTSSAAHAAAVSATSTLVHMLRKRDFSSHRSFLVGFERFLRLLHESSPLDFEALAAEVLSSQNSSRECRELLQRDLDGQAAELAPILRILNEASEIVLRVAGTR